MADAARKQALVTLKKSLKMQNPLFKGSRPPFDSASHRQGVGELYKWQDETRKSQEAFILHDGPPYANGQLHMGHALNKTLKDIIIRYQVLKGRRVHYKLGWDCHGLPIELKALQALHKKDELSATQAVEKSTTMTAKEIREAASKFAEETCLAQKENFLDWSIMADPSEHYQTNSKEFVIAQLKVFCQMLDEGLIFRSFRPVYWSPSSKTALAEAELEYNEDHISKAAFVKFPIENLGSSLTDVADIRENPVCAMIWTTTPWTIPANKAIAYNPSFEYSIVSTEKFGHVIVENSRLEHLNSIIGENTNVVTKFSGELLKDVEYRHPLLSHDAPLQPFLSADYVTKEAGTGLVHCAPGHGHDDYLVCQKHSIEPFSPVDKDGRFTADAIPGSNLEGKEVLGDGNDAVVDLLRQNGVLVDLDDSFKHSYPCDWRTKLPVILRSTAQWFANVENIKADAIESLKSVDFTPETGRNRLKAFVTGRDEWCISRQRVWGTPLPVLYDVESDEPLMTVESVQYIIDRLSSSSDVEQWWNENDAEENWVAPGYRNNGQNYKRGRETMDVWFDSGTSWTQIASFLSKDRLKHQISDKLLDELKLKPLADIYLEGSDQHRGWFQSSLLTHIAARSGQHEQKPPFRHVITHGFVLDENGRKMTKSLGNIVAPSEIITGDYLKKVINIVGKNNHHIKSCGVDTLRLWVASSDYTKDISLSTEAIESAAKQLYKFQVLMKFIIGNLQDFDTSNIVPYENLLAFDKLALHELSNLNKMADKAYGKIHFSEVVKKLEIYMFKPISAYCSGIRDRLYCMDGRERMAAQTVLYYALRNILCVIAPICPQSVESFWDIVPSHLKILDGKKILDPYRTGWFKPHPEWDNPDREWDFRDLRIIMNKVCIPILGLAREKRIIMSFLESQFFLKVEAGSEAEQLLKKYDIKSLEELFGTSAVTISSGVPEGVDEDWEFKKSVELRGSMVTAYLLRPTHLKCDRCRMYTASPTEGEEPSEDNINVCQKCLDVIDRQLGDDA